MAATPFDFPNSPAVGDKYPTAPLPGQVQYTWDGEKWTTVGPQITTALPATELPLMDGLTASVGISSKYAREDHIHMSEGSGTFVAKTGDTMTGELILNGSGWGLTVKQPGGGSYIKMEAPAGPGAANAVQALVGTTPRWMMFLGDGAPESGGNAGSDFVLNSYDDAGAGLTQPLRIGRAGVANFSKPPVVAGKAWAAPLDALAYNGMQINGAMEVSQEVGTGGINAPTIAAGQPKYICDGWKIEWGLMTTVPGSFICHSTAPTGRGYPKCLQAYHDTGFNFTAATDNAVVRQYIEGYRVSRLGFGTANAQPVTVAFSLKSGVAGKMGITLRNGDANRNITKTIDAVVGWGDYKLTFPGDTSGVWNTTNGWGLYLDFCLASGATNLKPPDVWAPDIGFGSTAGQANFVVAGVGVQLANVVVLPGVEAPSAAQSPLIMRPYDQELLTCQRYWRRIGGGVRMLYPPAFYQDPDQLSFVAAWDGPAMRAVPTAALVGTPNTDYGVAYGGGITPGWTMGIAGTSQWGALFTGQKTAHGITQYSYTAFILQAGGSLTLDARL